MKHPIATMFLIGILAICLACGSAPAPPPVAPPVAPSPAHAERLRAARALGAARERGHVTTERDEFRASVVVRDEMRLRDDMQLTFISTSEAPNLVGMLFVSDTSGWRYLRCHEVLALAGAEPVQMGAFTRNGTVRSGEWVTETMTGTMQFAEFLLFVDAPAVRFRVCGDVYSLSDAQRASLRTFVQSVLDAVRGDASTPSDAATEREH